MTVPIIHNIHPPVNRLNYRCERGKGQRSLEGRGGGEEEGGGCSALEISMWVWERYTRNGNDSGKLN